MHQQVEAAGCSDLPERCPVTYTDRRHRRSGCAMTELDRLRSDPATPAAPRLVPRGRGKPPAGQVSHRRDHSARARARRCRDGSLARARAPDPGLPRPQARDSPRRPAAGTQGTGFFAARALPRTCLPHARALQLLSLLLSGRPESREKFGACKLGVGARARPGSTIRASASTASTSALRTRTPIPSSRCMRGGRAPAFRGLVYLIPTTSCPFGISVIASPTSPPRW
jgi:hypothetical protein